MVFKKGDVVKLKAVTPQGPILAFRMEEDGTIFCLVEWTDDNGSVQQRWFEESQLVAA
jgi:uncharacterized protein YodC (DUF2158 family)